jgi:hypothetical protein
MNQNYWHYFFGLGAAGTFKAISLAGTLGEPTECGVGGTAVPSKRYLGTHITNFSIPGATVLGDLTSQFWGIFDLLI